ncbi:hypothetical protein IEO21_06839 [Rhodonia placenta]|uniref:Acetyl-CoA synthetase-like protein n=1 Tax=Rhodonia placenta TaxID=104341 RepID=A0A8H7NZ95_9APHY|nr:hypothetical protein IEO21_06839 [Postia placenta]
MSEIHGAEGPLPPIPDNMTLVQFMLDYRHPSRPTANKSTPWLIEDATGRKIGVDEIRANTQALATGLGSRFNIGTYTNFCIFSPNHIFWPVMIWYDDSHLDVLPSPANPSYTADELVHQLKTTSTKLIFAHPSIYPVALAAARTAGITSERIVLLDALPTGTPTHTTVPQLIAEGKKAGCKFTERKLAPGEARTKLAFLCFSSGTTGLPKVSLPSASIAVAISHYSLIANIVQIATYANADPKPCEAKTYRPGDVSIADVYGLVYILHFGLFYGMSIVVVPKFDFVNMLKSIERYRINYAPCVILTRYLQHPEVKKHDLSSLRVIVSGAAPLSGEITEKLSEVLPSVSIAQGFGMTETAVIVAMPRHDKKIGTPGSSGVLIPGTTARVLRPDGTLAARNEPGHLIVTGPSMASGYFKNEKATRETFIDGWVHTGDEVVFNDEGELFVVDRIKELLKVKGFQVAPAELEGFLLDHPDVADVCVVGINDDYHGDLPLAFVVPSAAAQQRIKADPAEAQKLKTALIKYVANGKVHYKQLTAGVELIDVIPRNPSGKLLRRFLRDRAREMWKQGKLTSATVKAKL